MIQVFRVKRLAIQSLRRTNLSSQFQVLAVDKIPAINLYF
jgi:hypothetical protein